MALIWWLGSWSSGYHYVFLPSLRNSEDIVRLFPLCRQQTPKRTRFIRVFHTFIHLNKQQDLLLQLASFLINKTWICLPRLLSSLCFLILCIFSINWIQNYSHQHVVGLWIILKLRRGPLPQNLGSMAMVLCIVTHVASVSFHVLPNSNSTISLAFSWEIVVK